MTYLPIMVIDIRGLAQSGESGGLISRVSWVRIPVGQLFCLYGLKDRIIAYEAIDLGSIPSEDSFSESRPLK